MMTEEEFGDWISIAQISKGAEQQIIRIRASAPSRRVEGRRSNISGSFTSRKMDQTIQFESSKVERPYNSANTPTTFLSITTSRRP